jgi:hypothetical protein
MEVSVNQRPIEVLSGMTVRHALIGAGLLKKVEKSKKVYDEWGNELGFDGALSEGMKIYIKEKDWRIKEYGRGRTSKGRRT